MVGSFARLICLLGLLVSPAAAQMAKIERGVAITDPEILRTLDGAELSLARLLDADASANSAALFALPSMAEVREATDRDFNDYVTARKGLSERLNLFDRDALNAQGTRFDLSGIVNRMDRAYVSPDTCGEIRMIYRPVAHHDSTDKNSPPSRLPMTFSVILKAKPANADVSCAELAKRWLTIGDAVPADPATLNAKGGALEWINRDAVDRIEINIQVARAAADPNDFEGRADYLMKVFRLDRQKQRFVESPMENQIDVQHIKSDAKLAADFRQWLLDPAHIADLDRGAIVLPDRFLATSVINETSSHVDLDKAVRDLFTEDDIVPALAAASARTPLENILSPTGFARRLDDMACAGCHRTRAVGGFHFPGAEQQDHATGAVVAVASPHFFGDQERRRDVLAAIRDSNLPDFSRGFSARPQPRRSKELAGTTYVDGWGATCYAPEADKSFASWTCAEGLICQANGASRSGFCFPKN